MNTRHVALYTAAVKGEWEATRRLEFNDSELKEKITEREETALHVAAIAEKARFVERLVTHLGDDTNFLETENEEENTALCYAATTGVVKIAKVMLEKYVPNQQGYYSLANCGNIKPLSMAASLGRHEMVRYLIDKTNLHEWTVEDRADLFTDCLRLGLFDVAMKMLDDFEDLATKANRRGDRALYVLACEPSLFAPKTQSCWRQFVAAFCTRRNRNNKVDPCPKAVDVVRRVYNSTMNTADELESGYNNKIEIAKCLLAAAEKGNDEFVIELIRGNPDLLWRFDTNRGTMFHVAARNRQEKIFSLLYNDLGSIKDLIADRVVDDGSNMLHLAAELAPSTQLKAVSGAALQMQRELLWFKEVEKIMRPSMREKPNLGRKTPQEVFDETHKDLFSAGEKWMKDTSKSSMLVAALIATVMFTAAFTVPGGFNNSNGSPIFQKRRCFFVFALSDALSLFCSSTAILMFHSIITSRYAENDFLESLPFRMVIGVASLFASVAAMMVAFCATFLLYFRSGNVPWIVALIAPFACVPSLYVSLKYPLLVDLLRSTHDSRFMFKPRKKLFL